MWGLWCKLFLRDFLKHLMIMTLKTIDAKGLSYQQASVQVVEIVIDRDIHYRFHSTPALRDYQLQNLKYYYFSRQDSMFGIVEMELQVSLDELLKVEPLKVFLVNFLQTLV